MCKCDECTDGDTRKTVSEAVFEKMVDGRVMRALYRDSRYRDAENAEAQAEAEQAIEDEAVRDLSIEYRVI